METHQKGLDGESRLGYRGVMEQYRDDILIDMWYKMLNDFVKDWPRDMARIYLTDVLPRYKLVGFGRQIIDKCIEQAESNPHGLLPGNAIRVGWLMPLEGEVHPLAYPQGIVAKMRQV